MCALLTNGWFENGLDQQKHGGGWLTSGLNSRLPRQIQELQEAQLECYEQGERIS